MSVYVYGSLSRMYLKMMVRSHKNEAREPEADRDGSGKTGPPAAPKSTEDLRPNIFTQQEKEG